MIVLRVGSGGEVMKNLTRLAGERGISDGAIVSLIGAVDGCKISNMATDDATADVVTEYTQPMELCGTGEITDGTVHIHVTLGREGDIALSGHLHSAVVRNFFVHAYVVPLEDCQ
jgi:uncharacterized protein